MQADDDSLVYSTALCVELGVASDYATQRRLGLHAQASQLVSITPTLESKNVELTPTAAKAWHTMVADARQAGVSFFAISGFRSYERQAELIRQRLATGRTLTDILATTAAPGYSEHHTGRAVDIGAANSPPLETSFETTAAFEWLRHHAATYGFHLSYPRNNSQGFIYEPWHWLHR